MEKFLNRLKQDYPELAFKAGDEFRWSPAGRQITYKNNASGQPSQWALLHEVAHSLLGHEKFTSDFGLLQAEVDAWTRALQLAGKYHLEIDQSYVEDCLDTYRDWLYRRSSCPGCAAACLQINNAATYLCHNCGFSWRVSRERFCRPYRLSTENKIATI